MWMAPIQCGYMILLVVWLSISTIGLVAGQDTVSLQLYYTGGSTACGSSSCSSDYSESYLPNYACSDGRGDWNGGFIEFLDPIPPGNGYVVWNITATVYGRFSCNSSDLLGVTLVSGELIPLIPSYFFIWFSYCTLLFVLNTFYP